MFYLYPLCTPATEFLFPLSSRTVVWIKSRASREARSAVSSPANLLPVLAQRQKNPACTKPKARRRGSYIPSSSVINADDLHYIMVIMVWPLEVDGSFNPTGDGDPPSVGFGLICQFLSNVLYLYFCPGILSECDAKKFYLFIFCDKRRANIAH